MKRITVFVAIFCLIGNLAFAGGLNRIGGVGPKAGGMSGAFTAVADDGSLFYYNLAGLSQFDSPYLYAGTDIVLPTFHYRPSGGDFADSKSKVHIMPLAAVIYPVSEKFTGGLGLTVPYGLGAEFDQTESLITLMNITPALAYKITDNLSIGAGLNIGIGNLKYLVPLATPDGQIVGSADTEATGLGFGASTGILWKPLDFLGLGISYSNPLKVYFDGETDIQSPFGKMSDNLDTSFTFPSRLTFGVAVRPTSKWLLAFDANWYDYSGADKISVDYKKNPDQKIVLDWEDNYSFHFGTEYQIIDGLFARTGFGYQTTPIPDSTVSPITPDVSGWDVSFGLGYHWQHVSVDVNYIYGWGERTVGVKPTNRAPGKYESEVHIIGFALSYQF